MSNSESGNAKRNTGKRIYATSVKVKYETLSNGKLRPDKMYACDGVNDFAVHYKGDNIMDLTAPTGQICFNKYGEARKAGLLTLDPTPLPLHDFAEANHPVQKTRKELEGRMSEKSSSSVTSETSETSESETEDQANIDMFESDDFSSVQYPEGSIDRGYHSFPSSLLGSENFPSSSSKVLAYQDVDKRLFGSALYVKNWPVSGSSINQRKAKVEGKGLTKQESPRPKLRRS